MSKTVDDLIGVYIEASNAVVWEAEKRGLCPMTLDMQRAGIAAVIRAVRDEVLQSPSLEDEGMVTVVDDIFDQILGSDAGEKVAGKNEGYSHAEPSPATDPAPAARSDATAVCEWTREHNLPGSGWFDCESNRHWIKSECPCCGKRIRFAEAK